ncbi:hypothetical protein, partial [Dubosiella newyorkensis]|uniref:hypothetical protein n=1 Tax=Dubosiella newyorkensis TaxID=1862672 RepID=UPI003F668521
MVPVRGFYFQPLPPTICYIIKQKIHIFHCFIEKSTPKSTPLVTTILLVSTKWFWGSISLFHHRFPISYSPL